MEQEIIESVRENKRAFVHRLSTDGEEYPKIAVYHNGHSVVSDSVRDIVQQVANEYDCSVEEVESGDVTDVYQFRKSTSEVQNDDAVLVM